MALRNPALALWIDVSAELDAEEVSWFAIRQPAVIKLLERELWDGDGDAFALGLDATCRVALRVAALDGAPPPRLSAALLEQGHMLARDEGIDRALARWVRWCVDAAPVVITAEEERRIVECVAAMLWAVAAADLASAGADAGLEHEFGDTIVA
jgi:hypothetical protein